MVAFLHSRLSASVLWCLFIVVLCSFLSQLLAVFRFLCLQLGYAAFRLRHWWVVAVSQLSPTHTHTHTVDLNPPSFAASSTGDHSGDQRLPCGEGDLI